MQESSTLSAAALGWSLIRCTPADLCMGETVDFIKGAIESRKEQEKDERTSNAHMGRTEP
jgi:hypothetical protein